MTLDAIFLPSLPVQPVVLLSLDLNDQNSWAQLPRFEPRLELLLLLIIVWHIRNDLNVQPSDLESAALPDCATDVFNCLPLLLKRGVKG